MSSEDDFSEEEPNHRRSGRRDMSQNTRTRNQENMMFDGDFLSNESGDIEMIDDKCDA